MSALVDQLSGLSLLLIFLAGLGSYFIFLKALPQQPRKKPPLRRMDQEDTDEHEHGQ